MNLELLLVSMLERSTCGVKSWQIYNEHGGVTFKIRFSHAEQTQVTPGVENICYAKKSPSKVARDRERSRINNENVRVTRSKVKKGNECEIEQPRHGDTITGEPLLADSPEPVTCVQSPVTFTDDLNASTPELKQTPMTSCSAPVKSDQNISVWDTTCDGGDNQNGDYHEHSDGHENNSSGDETDYDDPVDISTTPCHFEGPGHDDRWQGRRSTCTAPGCGIFLCHACIMTGKHNEHCDWIRFRYKRKKRVKGQKQVE